MAPRASPERPSTHGLIASSIAYHHHLSPPSPLRSLGKAHTEPFKKARQLLWTRVPVATRLRFPLASAKRRSGGGGDTSRAGGGTRSLSARGRPWVGGQQEGGYQPRARRDTTPFAATTPERDVRCALGSGQRKSACERSFSCRALRRPGLPPIRPAPSAGVSASRRAGYAGALLRRSRAHFSVCQR